MTWVIEALSPAPDNTRVDFTISHAPIIESMMIVYQGIRQVRVAVNPTEGEAEYGVAGTAVKMGSPPLAGSDLWTRYWY